MLPPMRIGIDLGGTKISGIAFDDADRVIWRGRRPTPRHEYSATLEAVVSLVDEAESAAGTRGSVGIGTPGAVAPATGLMKNANSTWLIGRPLPRDLEDRLGREVRLANDADCFALSEALDGAARGASVVFGVIAGTGVGGGVVVRGSLLQGPNAVAGEWGHNPLPWMSPDESPGPDCYCGKRGCIEQFLSGPGMSRDHEVRTGQALDPPALVLGAERGDADAVRTLERYAGRMARGLASVINLIDPEVIVLGGGMSNLAHLYDTVPARWGRYVFSDRVDTRLVPPRHGDDSGVRGAARLWPPEP